MSAIVVKNENPINIMKFGTLFVDNKGVSITEPYKYCRKLTLGNTVPDKSISWVDVQDPSDPAKRILVSDHSLICGIPWAILNSFDFAYGRPVCIDGQLYWCRSLRVPAEDNPANEWEQILKSTDILNYIWHWRKVWSWSQSSYQSPDGTHDTMMKNAFGGLGHNFVGEFLPDTIYDAIGFRPVLEPLIQQSTDVKDFIGQKLCIYGPVGHFGGVLTDVTDYDLIIHGTEFDGDNSWATIESSLDVIIDRNKVMYWATMDT